jgi:hypothetical protein
MVMPLLLAGELEINIPQAKFLKLVAMCDGILKQVEDMARL